MKDAYSFDTSIEGLDASYQAMYQAYQNIFSRCELDFRAVEADSGAIGGTDTHEFMVLSEIGEDTIAYSDSSDFAANVEIAPVRVEYNKSTEAPLELTEIDTPNTKTINELTTLLSVEASQVIKSILFMVDGQPVLVLVRGDHEVNEIKVGNVFNKAVVEIASAEQVLEILACETGFIGPISVPEKVTVIADKAVETIVNGVCGANAKDKHFQSVNPGRDFQVSRYEDLRLIQEGDPSPDGVGTIKFAKGIEVGHVFKLGTKYSDALGAKYLDENGKSQTMIMGCYGIGVTRTIAAIVEQNSDENGIVWPVSVAPFDLHLVTLNIKDEAQKQLGEELYRSLSNERFEVLYDDRPERAGVKFKDSDLIGLPIRIAVGKKASEGIVEVKVRKTGEMSEVHVSELVEKLKEMLSELR
ncbi:prolyl-tRNA synthetase [Halalkalibacter akibai JCM 9157]|uniref:Proline--tRNA ligase n=1 Tax=Halalkalibacter akibai (strain ATCC 43226 / DSM 21942 / CIP 109018 / JCM 9157 / 1139) TaxID=1236973 RepID=W4QV97_HALA3|nr:prolyl-tRNA synthetase [Halalkalibacter akibai JCM 9157]